MSLLRQANPHIQSLRRAVQWSRDSNTTRVVTDVTESSKHTIAQVRLSLKLYATGWKQDAAFSGSIDIAEHLICIARFLVDAV